MAKLGSYFGLCPLIDHRSLLGVYLDNEEGQVIVTLGKNIAMKYKISDQKQILSWTTKDKFTSPVIYDKNMQKYLAVFNYRYIRFWDDETERLDTVKKLRFQQNIYTTLSVNGTAYVVFCNGAIKSVRGIDAKSIFSGPLGDDEKVEDVYSCFLEEECFVGLLLKDMNNCNYLLWKKLNSNENEFKKIILERKDIKLVGLTLHIQDNRLLLLSLWSDHKLYRTYLTNENLDGPGQLFSIIESLNCQEKVILNSIDNNYLAMYGADSNQEGASVIIYNIQFKLTQLKQPLKLYTVGAKMWNIENKLFLTVGQNLSVLPYYLENEEISSLIGSHKYLYNQKDQDISFISEVEVANWSKHRNFAENILPNKIKDIASHYLERGYPENLICQELIPELIDKNDIESVEYILNYFCDVPEKLLVDLLYFAASQNCQKLLPLILSKLFNEIEILPHLRNKLTINHIVFLMNFILNLYKNDACLPKTNLVDSKVLLTNWLNVVINASYQLFLIKKDDSILKILQEIEMYVNTEIKSLENLYNLLPYLDCVRNSHNNVKSNVQTNYSIELIKFG